jgi:PEP-CTERM motif
MNSNTMKMGLAIAALASMSFGSAVITSGLVQLGVTDYGNLGYASTGLTYIGVGDATFPGCVCEGWGASANGIGGSANQDVGGISGLNLVSFSSTASTATSVTSLSGLTDLVISQAYAPSTNSALFQDLVTITNNSSATMTDVRYTRAMDWDVPPTTFNEYVTIGGVGAANLLYSSDNGFANPNPLVAHGFINGATVNSNFIDNGPTDHGAVFDFGFGSLAAGESIIFKIFYGATPNEADAFNALNDVGAEVYSLGQNSAAGGAFPGTPATFIFGFSGVGGTVVPPAVPEPSTLGLMGLGLALAGFAARRRKNKN